MNARDFFAALPIPIVQAPMVGAQGTELPLAVAGAGGLGSHGCGGLGPDAIERDAARLAESGRPYALNLFVVAPARPGGEVAAAAMERLAPWYAELGLPLPDAPNDFAPDFEAQFAAVVRAAPPVASFTFDRLSADKVRALQGVGTLVVGTAATVAEARAWAEVGADAICAQGAEAGGHHGHFLVETEASFVGTMALTPAVIAATGLPTIAAGGIMDGRGVAAALALGASAVQMGTAFLLADEARTSAPWRAAIEAAGDDPTRFTRAISGRFARGIETRFMREMRKVEAEVPAYPVQNRLTQPLRAAAVAAGEAELMSLWAGQGVKLIRQGRAADLVAAWWREATAVAQELAASTAARR
ncbi:MAG TPA: nitronate monooxygenase [Caulobacteraceae bacterium]|nr:nitronate monooxygenase [Caulobacteraceae bacterium]